MLPSCMNFIFESELIKIEKVVPDVLFYVNAHFPNISEADLFDLRIVYSELLMNAVIHGNKEDSSKMVELTVKINYNEIVSIIRDEGDGFDYLEILNGEEHLDALLCEHGRGLRLVSSLTEGLNFNNWGNEIEFRKKILDESYENHCGQALGLREFLFA